MAPVAAPAAHPLMKTRRRYAGLSFDGRLVSQEWRASGLDPGPDRRQAGIQGLGGGLELRHRYFQGFWTPQFMTPPSDLALLKLVSPPRLIGLCLPAVLRQSSNYSNVSTDNLLSVKKGSWSVLKDEPVSAADVYALGLLLRVIFNPTQRASSLKLHETPYCILDAPELAYDFYLILVDWNSTKCIGHMTRELRVSLDGAQCNCVQAMRASSNDNVSSVSCVQKGTMLSRLGCSRDWDALG
ncbi:hypothetical protein M405DRAFT_863615 [Rhizopogon salebrosus TDB-379]|nr:hypothetical protein M405DRAFT_863615 [Rhizopogon salebrosus TDB-379]